MILECEKCNARFLVADTMVPPEGRTVRCGACSHQWFVAPPAAPPVNPDFDALLSSIIEDEAAEEFPDTTKNFKPAAGANVPALKKRRIPVLPFKIAAPVIAVTWLVLAFMTYFPRWMELPVLSGIYGIFGIKPDDGLVFDDVHMEREKGDVKTRFIISGSIVNHAASAQLMPTVHVALNDKDGKALWARDYPVNAELKAGEVYPFRIDNIETTFADDTKTIVVELGHSLQLMMR